MLAPHYACLGLSSNGASAEEVRSAYRKAALTAHPDKGGTAAQFLSVVKAFEVLSDPNLRSRYDALWVNEEGLSSESDATIEERARVAQNVASRRSSKRQKADRNVYSATSYTEATIRTLLDKLFQVISNAPSDERRELVTSLTDVTRKALLSRFESQIPRKEAPRPSMPVSVCALEDDSSSSEAPSLRALGDAPEAPCAKGQLGRGASRLRGVSRRSFTKGVPLYTADVALRGFRARSRLYDSLEAAVECHIALMFARRAVCQDVSNGCGSFEQSIRRHFAPFSCGSEVKFFVQLHSHRVIGRKLYSPETTDLDIALDAFRRLHDAMTQGWPSLREAWINVQLEQGWAGGNRGRGRTIRGREELQTMTETWEANDEERQRRTQQREERRAVRASQALQEERESLMRAKVRRACRVRSLSIHYEAIIRRNKRKAELQEKALRSERLKWHRRKDLTMADILRGSPI